MMLIGLTGGIASGKNLVAAVFGSLGAHIIDADKIVHQLLEPGEEAWEEVLAYFGDQVALPDKTLDRRKIGEIVFNDPEKRSWLNKCLHPKVFEVYTSRIRHLGERQPDAVVVFNAALLIETGYDRKMDKVVLVYAEEKDQLARLMERDHYSREQAMARIRSQIPLAEKKAKADYVINNTGSRENAEHQAVDVFQRLQQEAREIK